MVYFSCLICSVDYKSGLDHWFLVVLGVLGCSLFWMD